MMVIHGSRLYGKVDQVPGLFYVATMFFHIQFVPLIPYQSMLLLDAPKAAGQGRGICIGLSGKSILFTWLRTASLLGGIILAFSTLACAIEVLRGRAGQLPGPLVGLAGLAAACFLFFWASYRLSRAGVARALKLATQAGIAPEILAQHFAERLSDADIEKLERLAQNAEEQLENESSSVEAR
jgi:hypothetical protein